MAKTAVDAAGCSSRGGDAEVRAPEADGPVETLRARLDRTGPLAIAEVKNILAGLSRALTRNHAAGHVHGTLDATAVWLSGDAVVRVERKRAPQRAAPSPSERTGPAAPRYRSPEQLQGIAAHGVHADLWAVAVLAYEALTGRPPFDGPSVVQTCLAVVRGRFAPPSTLGVGAPASLDAFFARAFAMDRKERFHAARDLERAFVGCLPSAADECATSTTEKSSAQRRAVPAQDGRSSARPTSSRRLSWARRVLVGAMAAGAALALVAAAAAALGRSPHLDGASGEAANALGAQRGPTAR